MNWVTAILFHHLNKRQFSKTYFKSIGNSLTFTTTLQEFITGYRFLTHVSMPQKERSLRRAKVNDGQTWPRWAMIHSNSLPQQVFSQLREWAKRLHLHLLKLIFQVYSLPTKVIHISNNISNTPQNLVIWNPVFQRLGLILDSVFQVNVCKTWTSFKLHI